MITTHTKFKNITNCAEVMKEFLNADSLSTSSVDDNAGNVKQLVDSFFSDKERKIESQRRFGKAYEALGKMLKQLEQNGAASGENHYSNFLHKCSKFSSGEDSGRIIWLCDNHAKRQYLLDQGWVRAEDAVPRRNDVSVKKKSTCAI